MRLEKPHPVLEQVISSEGYFLKAKDARKEKG